MSYESYRQSRGPSWMKGEFGQAWSAAHGQLADALVALWKESAKSAFPDECPADALEYLGSEIQIPRSPADTDATYGEKLRRAWEVWPFAGTPLGLLLALEAAGYSAGQVILAQQEAHLFTLSSTAGLAAEDRLLQYDTMGGRWSFGGGIVLWNRFGVIFPDSTNLPSGWAPVSPPTGATVPTKNEINGIIRLVNKWRRSAALFQYIRVCTAGDIWGFPVSQVWGDAGLVWGGTVVEFGPAEYP